MDELGEMRDRKDTAYFERNMLVAYLSTKYPAVLAEHKDDGKEWDAEWRNVVYIYAPTGQLSWHIHDSHIEWFSHLKRGNNVWDGHDTAVKHILLLKLIEWELREEEDDEGI